MKRLAIICTAFIILSGCGQKIHENISKEMVEDTEKIISIFDESIKDDRELTKKEEDIFLQYQVKYETMDENPELYEDEFTDEEAVLMILTVKMIEMYDYYTTLPSDKAKYETQRELIYNVIETGQI